MIDASAVRLVAAREVREQARGRVLWVSTALSLLAVAAVVILPHVLAGGTPTYRIAVVGTASGPDRQAIESAVASAGAKPRLLQAPDMATAQAQLQSRVKPSVTLVVDLTTATPSVVVDRALPADSTSRKALAAQAVARQLASERAAARSGLPPATVSALVNPQPLPVRHLRPTPGDSTDKAVAVAGAVLFYLLALRYGIGLLMGVAQEKSTRVIEVVLSTVRPIDLLAGKVIGYSLLVFVQALLLVGTALASAAAVGSQVLHAGAVRSVVEAGVWVVIGFLLYAALFAAAGALASRTEDAQSAGAPLQLLLLIGYFVSFTGLNGSPSPLVRIFAWVPFTAPMDMPVLAATGGAATWQVVASMLITVATTLVMMRAAAAVFSRSVLRTGQRVKVRQLWRERQAGTS